MPRKAAPELGREPAPCRMGNLACTCSLRDVQTSAFGAGPADANHGCFDITRPADGLV